MISSSKENRKSHVVSEFCVMIMTHLISILIGFHQCCQMVVT